MDRISRRDLLKSAATASLALAGIPALADSATAEVSNATSSAALPASQQVAAIVPLTSTSEVIIPPRGASFMKFSYDFPEPAVELGGLRISFRIHTFENTYGPDRQAMTVQAVPDGLDVGCTQMAWAGGQQTAPGKLVARIRKNRDQIEWSASAEMDQPIKSIVTIVRGVPRGKISAGGLPFKDHKDDEILLGYPFGAGSLFLERGWQRCSTRRWRSCRVAMLIFFTFLPSVTASEPKSILFSARTNKAIGSNSFTSRLDGSKAQN